jgi:hypothetical protein
MGIRLTESCKFCEKKVDRYFSLEQIHKMSNRVLNPPLIFGGGWECTHLWEPDPLYNPNKGV